MSLKKIYCGGDTKESNIAYLCNRKRCKECHPDYCNYTTDINYAMNFEKIGNKIIEKEVKNNE